MEFASQFEARRAAFIRQVDECASAHAASECARKLLDELLLNYAETEESAARRARAVALVRIAKASLGALESAVPGEVAATPATVSPARSRLKTIAKYAPAALAAVLTVWLLLSNLIAPAFVALLAACLSLIGAARAFAPDAPEMRYDVSVRVSGHELARQLSFLLREIDELLPDAAADASTDAPGTRLLEAAQMLMEAQLTHDGAFALKSVPQLVDAFARQGISFSRLDEGDPNDFDLLPGAVGGKTIRPAVLKDGALLLRGQATVKK